MLKVSSSKAVRGYLVSLAVTAVVGAGAAPTAWAQANTAFGTVHRQHM